MQATTGLTTGTGANTGVNINPTTKEHVKDAANTAYNKARAWSSRCVQGSASVPRQELVNNTWHCLQRLTYTRMLYGFLLPCFALPCVYYYDSWR